MSPRADPELRLALGMRGGVSLAVWIGGACAEIDAARRSTLAGSSKFWSAVIEHSAYSSVVVDVMAGASAGGLNGVVYATALRHDFDMAEMRDTWLEVADVNRLRRTDPEWTSVFDGDGVFLRSVLERLKELTGRDPSEAADRDRSAPYVDLQLTTTLVEPLDRAVTSPTDEPLRRSRSSSSFHFRFRHEQRAVQGRSDLKPEDLDRLALAARCTASFPFAFEPALVRSTRPDEFCLRPTSEPDRPTSDLVDCRDVFSERRGAAVKPGTGAVDPKQPQPSDFVVADGGIVDNIPLGKALEAIHEAPADGPTRRVLVYLHPTGPAMASPAPAASGLEIRSKPDPEREIVRRRGPLNMAKGLWAARLEDESIDGDLDQIEAHNRGVRMRRAMRKALAAELDGWSGFGVDPPDDVPAAANGRRVAYVSERAAADAEQVLSLLRDPLGVLGADPFPVAPAPRGARRPDLEPDDRWRAPLARWSAAHRLALDLGLAAAFTERLDRMQIGPEVLGGGLGPLQRATDVLLELVRALEGRGVADLTAVKRSLYRIDEVVRRLGWIRQLGWVTAAGGFDPGRWPGLPDEQVVAWLEAVHARLNAMLRVAPDVAEALAGAGDPSDVFARLLDASQEALQELVSKPPPEAASAVEAGAVDVREQLKARLGSVAQELVDVADAHEGRPHDEGAATSDDGAEVLLRILRGPDELNRLAFLEVLLHREQLLAGRGGVEIGFARLSAAAPIVRAERFELLYARSKELLGDEDRPDFLHPDVKLAGNELGSFAAFLDASWRANDWTWGRLDAVPTLVDLLLDVDGRRDPGREPNWAKLAGLVSAGTWLPPHTSAQEQARKLTPESVSDGAPLAPEVKAEVRRGLIHLRQQEILDELKEWPKRWDDVKPPEDPAMWEVGLAKVNDPGSTAMAESIGQLASVAARVVGAALPPTVPRVVGPLQSIAGWLGRHLAAPVRHPSGPGSMSERWKPWRDTLGLAFGAAAVGLLAAALVWAVADSQVSLAIGVGVGLLLAVAPAAAFALVAVTTEINPNEGKRRRTKAITVACWFGSFVSAVGAAVLTVVSMRLGWGALLVIAGVVLVVVVVAPVRRRWCLALLAAVAIFVAVLGIGGAW